MFCGTQTTKVQEIEGKFAYLYSGGKIRTMNSLREIKNFGKSKLEPLRVTCICT